MILPVVLAACLAVSATSDQVVARDLAASIPEFARVPPDTVVGWAPAPGVQRVFHAAELRRMGTRLGISAAPRTDVCVERPVAPLDPARVLAILRQQLPEARIELVEFSRQPAPAGDLEFPLAGLRPQGDGGIWRGSVRYGGSHRFAVWVRVRVRLAAPLVIAAEDLKPGRTIEAAQVRVETREGFPRPGMLSSVESALGKRPRQAIRMGTPLCAASLEPAPDVSRGEDVTVEISSGAAHFELEARAERAASVGQRVAVRNPFSNQRFFARVVAKGRVSVRPENP